MFWFGYSVLLVASFGLVFSPKLVKQGKCGLWDPVSVFAGLFLWQNLHLQKTAWQYLRSMEPCPTNPFQSSVCGLRRAAVLGRSPSRHCWVAGTALAPVFLAEGFTSSGKVRHIACASFMSSPFSHRREGEIAQMLFVLS